MTEAYRVVKCIFHFAGLGLLVFLDIVHSYSAADEMVGLSLFDGSNDCYFHTGICSNSLCSSLMDSGSFFELFF